MTELTSPELERRVREYMDACTSGDTDLIASYFSPGAVHYFPPGMYQGPFVGARTIAQRWNDAVRDSQSSWTVDAIAVDIVRRQAVAEWTHFKQRAGVMLRGCEWYEFTEDGLITEIRAYYASPQAADLTRLELGGFDYQQRGYPEHPRSAMADFVQEQN